MFPNSGAAEGSVTTAYHGRGALTRRTGASRGSLSAAGWASGTAAASCRPGRCGAALRCSGRGEAPAASGGDRGDVGDQSAFGICWAGPENHRFPGMEHPSPSRSPPPGTAQPPGSPPGHRFCAAAKALGEVGPCVGLQDEEAVRPKLPGASSKWEARPPAL